MSTIRNSAIALLALGVQSYAAVLIPTDAASWDNGSPGNTVKDGTGSGGLLQTTTLTLGLTKPNVDDPSTWTTTRNWVNDFQGQYVDSLTSNPWLVYDLGSIQTGLDQMFIINVSETTGWQRGIKTFNLWYTDTPGSNAVPVWAGSNNLSDGAANVKNYNFAAGGWTKLNVSDLTLDRGAENEGGLDINPIDGTFDLSAISSARYIGIEALTSYNETTGNPFGTATGINKRVGINQIAFTTVPEPSAALLGSLGALLLMRRRR